MARRCRVQCFIDQASVDIPAAPPPPPSKECPFSAVARGTYLAGYPTSLPSDGVHTPSAWPYNVSSLSEAQSWCCLHADCGGVTHQNGRFEARAGGEPITNPPNSGSADSWARVGADHGLNRVNLTKCVVTRELDFTQATGSGYPTRGTPERTVAVSKELLARYGL